LPLKLVFVATVASSKETEAISKGSLKNSPSKILPLIELVSCANDKEVITRANRIKKTFFIGSIDSRAKKGVQG